MRRTVTGSRTAIAACALSGMLLPFTPNDGEMSVSENSRASASQPVSARELTPSVLPMMKLAAEGVYQRGLADAGLAGDEDDLALASGG